MTAEKKDPSQREFHVTPKSSSDWFAAQYNLQDWNVRLQVAKDMFVNAKELESGVDWAFILDNHVFAVTPKKFSGVPAIAHSLGFSVASVVKRMDWDMHSPEVVYMSGYYFYWAMSRDLARLNKRIEDTEQGHRKFLTEEMKAERLKQEKDEASKIGAFAGRILESLTQYANQNHIPDDRHKLILQSLLFIGHSNIGTERYKLMDLLRSRNIDGAYEVIKQHRAVDESESPQLEN